MTPNHRFYIPSQVFSFSGRIIYKYWFIFRVSVLLITQTIFSITQTRCKIIPMRSGFEEAKKTLWEAVDLDERGLPDQALVKYMIGIDGLIQYINEFEEPRRSAFKKQVEQYLSRAETLKSHKVIKVEFLEQRRILDNSTGHSYESIFSKCLDDKVTKVSVEEPWLGYLHQVINFVKLCEVFVRNCPKLNNISLLTQNTRFASDLEELRESLRPRSIELSITYKENMHDREIRFNNGWLVKIGRGLDIYKNIGKFAIGSQDYHLRPCKATTIEVFKTTEYS